MLIVTSIDPLLTSSFPLTDTAKRDLSNPSTHVAHILSWLLYMSIHTYI